MTEEEEYNFVAVCDIGLSFHVNSLKYFHYHKKKVQFL